MIDFVMAALPWVIIALIVAVLVTVLSKKKIDLQISNDESDSYLVEGMLIGLCLGSIVGTLGIFNIGIALSIGMLSGLTVGNGIKKHK